MLLCFRYLFKAETQPDLTKKKGAEKLTEKDIKSGEEIVHEFFEKVKDDNALDEKTRDALYNLYKKGSFTRTQIKKALEKVREEALGEKENADQTEKNQD